MPTLSRAAGVDQPGVADNTKGITAASWVVWGPFIKESKRVGKGLATCPLDRRRAEDAQRLALSHADAQP